MRLSLLYNCDYAHLVCSKNLCVSWQNFFSDNDSILTNSTIKTKCWYLDVLIWFSVIKLFVSIFFLKKKKIILKKTQALQSIFVAQRKYKFWCGLKLQKKVSEQLNPCYVTFKDSLCKHLTGIKLSLVGNWWFLCQITSMNFVI